MLEIIATNVEDILKINSSNADRIEFCHNLEVGGVSPDVESLEEAVEASKKDLMVMLRINFETFELSTLELNKLIDYINEVDRLNFNGYVFGVLKEDAIDIESVKKIQNHLDQINSKKEITFHKAFDFVSDKAKGLLELEKFSRFKTVLTSGGLGNPANNIKTIQKLNSKKIKILIGGGVNKTNLEALLLANCHHIHLGTAVRKNNSWNEAIIVEEINLFISHINQNK